MLASLLSVVILSASGQDPDALRDCAPATLDAAFQCLDEHWSSRAEFEALRYDQIIGAHFGVGMWMRNNWGMWGGGPLALHFNEMGIEHPDDMSGIVLTSYWLRLHNCPIRLDDQVARYKAFWDRAEHGGAEPVETNLDCTVQQGAAAQ